MSEPEVGTEHAQDHNVFGALESHEHLHGEGAGQHVHEGWKPDRVIARMKRDGFCGYQDSRGGICMTLAITPHQHAEAT